MPANPADGLARKVEEAVRAYDTLSQTRAKVAALVRDEVEAERERLLAPVLAFVNAQGCGCCGADYETRSRVDRALGVALGVPLFDDESGTNWDAAAIRARGAKKEESDAE